MKKYKVFLKSICIVMITQALVYFFIKIFLNDYNVIESFMNTPFLKGFVYFYDSWYPIIAISAFVIYYNDFDNYKSLLYTMLLGALLSHITFLIYPTMIVRPVIEVNNITDFILDFTYKTDTPAVNCLPSVHCLFCFIMSYYLIKTKNLKTIYKIIMCLYLLLIVLSTLFIKQHIIEDVILSFIYAAISIIIVYILKSRLDKLLKFIY
jgi:membrane-associated phospholipid phosphatase